MKCYYINKFMCIITKTCLYNVHPLKLTFYIVNWGLQGYKLFFLFLLKNIACGYSLEPPCWGGSNEYPQSVLSRNMKIFQSFLSENFHFLKVKFYIYLNRFVFVMYPLFPIIYSKTRPSYHHIYRCIIHEIAKKNGTEQIKTALVV